MVRFNLAVTLLVVTFFDFATARDSGLQSPSRRLDHKDGGSGSADSCDDSTNFPNDCARTLPDFMINLLKLGFDEDTLVNSGFGFGCNFDVEQEWDRLCCSASAMRATLGFTWQGFFDFGGSANINTFDECGPFIPSTVDKPNWLQSYVDVFIPEGVRRRMEEGGSSKQSGMSDSHAMLEDFFDMNELPHALDRMFKDDDMRRQLGVPDAVIDEAKRRGRKLQGIEFESDDGVVCLLAVVFAGFIEFYINEEITGEGGDTTAIAAGVADFVRQLGCDFSGLLTQRCEDWAPQVDVGDLSGFDEVVRGYVGSELSFLICKLIKEAIAAFSLFIFSPWLLPACYCNYKHEVGCNIESCYDPVASDECCLAEESTVAPTEAPPAKWTAKPDLVDDLTVAYGRYFPYLPFTALLRACNAKPGPGTYFTPRLPNGNIGDIPLFEGFRIRDIFDFSSSGSGASKKGSKNSMDSLDDEEQFLKDLGQCCNLYDPSEDYSFTDGLNCYELIETTTSDDMSDDCATPCVRMCMEQEKGYTMTEFEFAINAIEASVDGSDFDRVAVVAGAFYLAQGGDPGGIETGVEGIIAELLGEDLLQGLLDLELGGGLFPIRRGGAPLDKCLGFCFMQGSLANLEGFGGGICGAN